MKHLWIGLTKNCIYLFDPSTDIAAMANSVLIGQFSYINSSETSNPNELKLIMQHQLEFLYLDRKTNLMAKGNSQFNWSTCKKKFC